MNIRLLFFTLALLLSLSAPLPTLGADAATQQHARPAEEKPAINENYARIQLSFKGKEAVAVLNDTPTSRDFLKTLPAMLECGDYNHLEKLSYLPRKLETQGAPDSCTPTVGTIGYYIAWGSLAIFYHDFKPTPGLVPLGRVVSGIENLANTHGDFYLRIDNLEQPGFSAPK